MLLKVDYRAAADDSTIVVRKKVGAPLKMENGARVNVYLDASSLATSDRIGAGNMSAGIRLALKRAEQESLDDESLAIAVRLGDGDINAGIRLALKRAAE